MSYRPYPYIIACIIYIQRLREIETKLSIYRHQVAKGSYTRKEKENEDGSETFALLRWQWHYIK